MFLSCSYKSGLPPSGLVVLGVAVLPLDCSFPGLLVRGSEGVDWTVMCAVTEPSQELKTGDVIG